MAQSQISPADFDKLHRYYLKHPEEFVTDVLGAEPWEKQIEIIRSTFTHKITAVKTSNAVGKSFIAARIVITYLMLYPNSIVVTTAPTWSQVTDVLWREIGTALKQAKYKLTDQEATQAGLNLGTNWYAVGRSTKRPENFFGYHADHILVVVDEAGGVEEPIFKGVMAITPNVNARILLIGNPTSPSGTFYNYFTKPELGANCFTISAFDSPNFTSVNIKTVEDLLTLYTPRNGIPQAEWTTRINDELNKRMNPTYRGLIHPSTVYGKYHELGVDHPNWQSLIMGEFPSQAEQALIPADLVIQAMSMSKVDDATGQTYAELSGWEIPDGPPEHGQDMARFGADNCVNIPRHGGWVELPVVWNKIDLMESANRILKLIDPMDRNTRLNIDDTGNGCVTSDTKLLTPRGWMKAQDLKDGDKVYSKDHAGKVVVETVLSNSSRSTDVLAAGGYKFSWCHLLPYRTRLGNHAVLRPWQEILERKQVIFESDFRYEAKKKGIRLPKQQIAMPNGGVKLVRETQAIDPELFAEFLGWYVAEGCLDRRTYSIIISQRKNQHFDRIVELCNLFGKPQIKQNMKSGHVFNIRIFNKPLYDWIKRYCYNGGYGFKFKTVPRFIANNSQEVIDAFLGSYCNGDGFMHHGERYYCTSSVNLVDDLVELIHKLGKKSGSYCKQLAGSTAAIEGRPITRSEDCWVVFEAKQNKRGYHYGISPNNIEHTFEKVQSITITGETKLFYTLVPGAKPIWTHNGGTTDRLRQISAELAKAGHPAHRYQLVAYNFSSKEFMRDPDTFHDITSELYWNLRDWFIKKRIALPNHPRLRDELIARRWWLNKSGKIQVESKDEYKKRTGGKSPDFSDALALAFAGGLRRVASPDLIAATQQARPVMQPLTAGVTQRF